MDIFDMTSRRLTTLALIKACSTGMCSVVRSLIDEFQVDPSMNKSRAILIAALRNHMEVVRVLMQYPQVDVGQTAVLRRAMTWGDPDIVKTILSNPVVRPSAYCIVWLVYQAAWSNQHENIKLLMQEERFRVLLSPDDINKIIEVCPDALTKSDSEDLVELNIEQHYVQPGCR